VQKISKISHHLLWIAIQYTDNIVCMVQCASILSWDWSKLCNDFQRNHRPMHSHYIICDMGTCVNIPILKDLREQKKTEAQYNMIPLFSKSIYDRTGGMGL
jgi:hypothetical protein